MMPEPKKQAEVLRDIYEDWNKDKKVRLGEFCQ